MNATSYWVKMTIKIKLIANVLVTAAILVTLSLASFFSMRFLDTKLRYLTEKSTPFQMQTLELQRELQESIAALLKVNTARNKAEYIAFKAEAEKYLAKVRTSQQALEKTGNSSSSLSAEFDKLAQELFSASEARIESSEAAAKANAKVSRRMQVSTARLKELEGSVRRLQTARSAAFAQAVEHTGESSAQLRSIESLRDLFKDLKHLAESLQNPRKDSSLLLVKGRFNTLAARIQKNDSFKANQTLAAQCSDVIAKLAEQIKRLSAAPSRTDDAFKNSVAEVISGVLTSINSLFLSLDQEMESATEQFEIEVARQQDIFSQSGNANGILVTNSELVTAGVQLTAEINSLFNLETVAELERVEQQIQRLFNQIQERVQTIEVALAGLKAEHELQMLRAAAVALLATRNEVLASDGILAALKMKVQVMERADRTAATLYAMVSRQTVKGNEIVSIARGEQQKAVAAVNTMISQSLYQSIGIGSAAVVLGVLFGYWIYRSVLPPLRLILYAVRSQQVQGQEKAQLAEAVANGDLSQPVTITEAIKLDEAHLENDEMGMVLKAVVGMSEAQATLDRAFIDMTESLRTSRDEEVCRDRLKSGLHELNKIMRGEYDIQELAEYSLAFMAAFLDAGVGIIYLHNDSEQLLLPTATYAISLAERPDNGVIKHGEGLVGQVAMQRKAIHLETVPQGYLPIASALGEADPLQLAILPIMHNNQLAGVLELGSFKRFGKDAFEFLDQALEGMAIVINANHSRQLVYDLLEQTQSQSEELRLQQEELQQTNEELEERARMFEARVRSK
jgi:uncharacterized membrane protein YciS (DUF1049 family)